MSRNLNKSKCQTFRLNLGLRKYKRYNKVTYSRFFSTLFQRKFVKLNQHNVLTNWSLKLSFLRFLVCVTMFMNFTIILPLFYHICHSQTICHYIPYDCELFCQSLIVNYQSLLTSYQSLLTSYQSLITSYQSLLTSY